MSATLAILGAGQLGRMLGLSAARLGVACRFLDPAAMSGEACPASAVGEVIAAEYTDQAALDRLAAGADAVTYEFENVPAEAVDYLAGRGAVVRPGAAALRTAQDRLLEKRAFADCGIPTNQTAAWDGGRESLDDLHAIVERLGLPVVLKSRRMGYDGKGQAVVRRMDDLARTAKSLARVPVLVEAFVPFTRELSIVAARGVDGAFRAYPLVENTHKDGILRRTVAPAPGVSTEMQARAEASARALMERLDYVGVMALELFEVATPTGPALLANEIAPRVHNTGHWTIEAARTSQFENHCRAVLGLPLGETGAVGHSVMVNLIGVRPDPARVLAIPGTSLHWYGKAVRPGRKVGHVTVWADSAGEARVRAERVETLL